MAHSTEIFNFPNVYYSKAVELSSSDIPILNITSGSAPVKLFPVAWKGKGEIEGVDRGEAHRNILTAFRPFPVLFLNSNKNALIIIINRTNGVLRVVIHLHAQHDWIKNHRGITLLDVSVESFQKAFTEETRSTVNVVELFRGHGRP